MLMITSELCVDKEDLLRMLPRDEGFCIGLSLFRRDEKASQREKKYTELLAPKLGFHQARKFLLKLQGSARRMSHPRAYNFFKRLPFRA